MPAQFTIKASVSATPRPMDTVHKTDPKLESAKGQLDGVIMKWGYGLLDTYDGGRIPTDQAKNPAAQAQGFYNQA